MKPRGFIVDLAAVRAEIESRSEVKRLFALVRDRQDQSDLATRAWLDAIARNNLAFRRVYPDAFWDALADLKQTRVSLEASATWTPAHPESIETCIRFLEADIICFRSGYVKERLIRRLVRQRLAPAQEVRLRRVALDVLDRRGGRDFRAFCRLAARVADADLHAAVATRLTAADLGLRRRAGWMRDAIVVATR